MKRIDTQATAERIAKAIKDRGENYDSVSDLLDVERQTVYKWCKGMKRINLENALALSELLGVDIYHLIARYEDDCTV